MKQSSQKTTSSTGRIWLRRIGIVLASLVVLVLAFYAFVYFQTESRINKVYEVSLQKLPIPDDSASYALGKHVAETRGCLGCHGQNLAGGRALADESTPIGVLYVPNITSGKGGIQYTDEDYIRVLRHGLNKENKPVWFMPSHEVCHISNQDMAALIGYLKKQPPVDHTVPEKSLKPLGRFLTFIGEFPLLPAEKIDHATTVYVDKVTIADNAETGQYLATTCQGCHGPQFKGAAPHGPNEPPIPDISSTGKVGKWSEAGFVNLFHTGKTPEGKLLSQYMPVKEFNYSDQELRAIYKHLHQSK